MKRLGCKFSDVATYAMLYSSKTEMMIQDAMIFMEVWRVDTPGFLKTATSHSPLRK